jgi:sigma-B regulation protein RsbU (phosphoserine phosphatase)
MHALTLVYSDADGAHTVALERPSTSIGRSAEQDIVLNERCVSRRHAVILLEGEQFLLEDLGSTHGTFLNGARTQRAKLQPGDVLQFGSLTGPRLHLRAAAEGAIDSPSHSTLRSLVSSMIERPATDVPRAGREMEQLNWLLRAARQLNEGGAVEDILGALLQLTLQLTHLERGFVFLHKSEELRLVRGLDAQGAVLEENSTVSRTAMHNAIRSRSKFSISDTVKDSSAAEWLSVMEHRIRSIYCIPLRKPGSTRGSGELLGLLYLDSDRVPGKLTDVDEQLLGTIATEAAALVHNALLAEAEFQARQAREELAVAAAIHRGLMSAALPELPYAALQAKSVPCLAIGGDFYDALELKDSLGVVLADISGKGVSAAIVAATLQGIVHSQLLMGRQLAEIAALVNQFLCTRKVGKYATMIVLQLYPDGRLDYINCGHIPPYRVLGSEVGRLEESNMVVGLIAGAQYSSASCVLRPGERVLLVTDGLTEAEDSAGEAFGEPGMTAICCEPVGEILDRVAKFQAPNPAQDDCTLVAVELIA